MAKEIHSEGQSFIVSNDVDVDNLDVENMVHKPGLVELINEFKKNKSAKQTIGGDASVNKMFEDLNSNEVELHLFYEKKDLKFDALLNTVSLEDSAVKYSFGMLLKDALELNNLFLKSKCTNKNKDIFLSKVTIDSKDEESNKQKSNLSIERIFINKNYEKSLVGIVLVEIHFVSKGSE